MTGALLTLKEYCRPLRTSWPGAWEWATGADEQRRAMVRRQRRLPNRDGAAWPHVACDQEAARSGSSRWSELMYRQLDRGTREPARSVADSDEARARFCPPDIGLI